MTVVASVSPTVTSFVTVPRVSCQTLSVYLPGGTLSSANSPAAPVTAWKGCSITTTHARIRRGRRQRDHGVAEPALRRERQLLGFLVLAAYELIDGDRQLLRLEGTADVLHGALDRRRAGVRGGHEARADHDQGRRPVDLH